MVRLSVHNTCSVFFFFFNDTATTEIYTLSLHDALPISQVDDPRRIDGVIVEAPAALPAVHAGEHHALEKWRGGGPPLPDRKRTPLNTTHRYTTYSLFFFEKKKKKYTQNSQRQGACCSHT